MKYSIFSFRFITIICISIVTIPVQAVTFDYLTNFKIPVQQTFCLSKSPNGDIKIYKQCMLAIEKDAYKCDTATKESYDQMIIKYSNLDKEVGEFMDDIMPITEKHFTCLNTLY